MRTRPYVDISGIPADQHTFAGGGITRTCTFFNCFSSTGLGEPHIKSPPLCVF